MWKYKLRLFLSYDGSLILLVFFKTIQSMSLFVYRNQTTSEKRIFFKPLSTIPTKWPNTLKQFVSCCLSGFDHFVGLTLKELRYPQFVWLPPCSTEARMNLFHANFLFLYPPKSSENPWILYVFRGHKKRPVVWNESKMMCIRHLLQLDIFLYFHIEL